MNVEIGGIFPSDIEAEGTVMDVVDDEFVFVIKDEVWTDEECQAMKRNPLTLDFVYKYDISSTEIKKEKIRIHTIRQLYSVCVMNDDDEEINNTKVKEIFAGRKTSYLYTKYISGIKLVECSYQK